MIAIRKYVLTTGTMITGIAITGIMTAGTMIVIAAMIAGTTGKQSIIR